MHSVLYCMTFSFGEKPNSSGLLLPVFHGERVEKLLSIVSTSIL